ncbi:hypothetical protein MCOR27_000837 [Pyricularia oryzae]|uniref:Uncharacterized protein n=1 Tax=Pyricularia oryzae TaxID=318829 RepID=A0A4P7NLC9_PYROR|nr:hypothetical protein MCOR27_000837 [Pyricularia oryzae]KAI6295670.1 hypothetical protein MCOR34_009581 [Pyricularia oryzae]KAI6508918.1 hypothetical protein MCOR13_001861 [Pyricularia oryzae]KAI6639508.1 hypothetical protein MCOR14_003844 [Pyricularia oryzae]QBZ62975.1 hypothetical protein PoMZ_11865 [Pyricularia oryzae]
MPESWFLHRLFHRSGRCSFLVADRNWGDEVDSQLLQGSMDKTIKLNLERLPDIPSNHAKGHVISDSFSEVLWSQAREAAGLDVAHRQTSSSLANLGLPEFCYYVSRYCEASKLLGMAYDACHFCRE